MSATPSEPIMMLARIAAKAGAVVMRHYEVGCGAREKADRSPVTDADEETERLILSELGRAFPGVPVVAEEQMAAGHSAAAGACFFLVDPLDGTREFLSRNGEFTVNIAEIADGVPVRGAVYAPARHRMFVGGDGAAFEMAPDLKQAKIIQARHLPADGLVAVGSRSHGDPETENFLKKFTVREFISAGSSLKFCLLAAGEADLYPRHGRTMEWDTAAGHAVLSAAGGSVTRWDGEPLIYGKPGFENPPFVARGRI
ncbi:MAG TPA: 3'(2'),5'-bisphosphate nucleotidase CysQ [Rhizomicrobium sp.]|nr:3'(2'),5'-bisphosphate nucleotidase CysQ [Rhizomicrobium sp.]